MTVMSTRWSRDSPRNPDGYPQAKPSPSAGPGRLLTGPARRVFGRGLPRRTARLRLTVLYGALFLVSGAVLLGIIYGLVDGLLPSPPRPSIPSTVSQKVEGAIAYQRAAILHALLLRSTIVLAILLVVSVGFGWLMAGRVLRPLRTITAATRQISEENLHERLALVGPDDELKELGDTIDGLLGRLEGAFEAQRNAFETQRAFVANASHELRTPLTMMRTSIDVATRSSRALSPDDSALATKVRKGLDQADRLVESFLALARAQSGVMTDLTAVPLSLIASQALDAQSVAVGDRELLVRVKLADVEVYGNETLLARMTANVIDNAVLYNEPGGFIEVTTEADGPTARLMVESGGSRLDQDHVQQLVQPFRRLGPERTGSDTGVGLGLSIVAAISTAHGGATTLWARDQGGLRVTVELPCWRPSADVGLPG